MKSNLDTLSSDVTRTPITAEQTHELLQLQRNILELVALGKDHQQTLNKLCIAAEQMLSNSAASILVYNDTQTHLEVLAAPSLSAKAVESLNGLVPGYGNGSCGTAVYSNEAQFVNQVDTDPRWKNVRQFAVDFILCACWSMPVRIEDNRAVGSFALSSFEKRQPSEFHKQLLETAAYNTGIILKRQIEEKKLWELAHHDPLTQLPNRLYFQLRLEQAVKHAQCNSLKLGLIYLDLDQFKDINDTLGHEAGDEVLKQTAQYLKKCLRREDTLARLGGDEFIILIENIYNAVHLQNIAEKILTIFSEPIKIQNDHFQISASIGISVSPDDGFDPKELMKMPMPQCMRQNPKAVNVSVSTNVR